MQLLVFDCVKSRLLSFDKVGGISVGNIFQIRKVLLKRASFDVPFCKEKKKTNNLNTQYDKALLTVSKKSKSKVLLVRAMKVYRGRRSIAPLILKHCTVIIFSLRPPELTALPIVQNAG